MKPALEPRQEKQMKDTRLYRASTHMDIRFSTLGTALATTPRTPRPLQIALDALDVLAIFSQESYTADDAFDSLSELWEIDRQDFEELFETWVAAGVLVPASHDGEYPSRLGVFLSALERWKAQGQVGPLPLESQLPLQGPSLFYPGLSALEFHPKHDFPWVAEAESAFPAIRRELDRLREEENGFSTVYRRFTQEGEWAGAFFWAFGDRVDANCERCPETIRLIDSLPVAKEAGTVSFSALAPNSRVTPHYGNTNGKLRCQLPLRVPGRSVLKVGSQEAQLEEGSCVVFDDSFLHTAWNESDEARFVLLFDFFHPDLQPIERAKLTEVIQGSGTYTSIHLDQVRGRTAPDWVRES